MFSKPNKSTSTRSEAEPRKSVPASLIAENVVFHGDMASDGDVHLDGTVLGDVRVGLLTVGETAPTRWAKGRAHEQRRGRRRGRPCVSEVSTSVRRSLTI
jgi:hypothetical protein